MDKTINSVVWEVICIVSLVVKVVLHSFITGEAENNVLLSFN